MIKGLKYCFLLFASFLFFKSYLAAHELPPGFAAIQVADGLDPVSMALAPDGRIFFTEKNGRVRIVENGQVLLDPFIEIDVDNFNERGLSGIAIDPDFPNSPYVYLYYTVSNAEHNRLSRFRAEGNFALPGSEEVLLEFDSLGGPNHNAGALTFANDGTLFIAVGDGRKEQESQSLQSLFGKILRIHKDGSIPSDNPFFNQTSGKYRSIWSLGHRNPFAMFYEKSSDRLFTTDVGNYRAEELNEVFKGMNYGWPALEGNNQDQSIPPNYVSPLFAYDHNFGCAAVGITSYQPNTFSFPNEYWDKLFFSDYCNGKIMLFDPLTQEVTDFASDINRPLNLLVAPDGSLYYMARAGFGDGSTEDNTTSNNGSLWRIFYTGNDAPFIAVQPKSTLVSTGENAKFEMAVSGALPLSFKWRINGVETSSADQATYIFENASLVDSASMIQCIVTNAEGADTSDIAILHVTSNQRPTVEISAPSEDWIYKGGDTLFFSGHSFDPETGQIPNDQLTWKLDFHHDTHTHPALGPLSGVSEGYFIIPQSGEVSDNVWYRLNLSGTDALGLQATTQRLIFPEKSNITVKTYPPGLPVVADDFNSNTPYIVKSVVGVFHDFDVPVTAVTSDSVYIFKQWNTGATNPQILYEALEEDVELIAEYEAVQALADGQGLTATYFNDALKDFTFQEPFIFRRIDPQVEFNWGLGTPDENYLGEDYFLVRWEGFIKPVFSDTFNFHLITNDGSRLWIDEKSIINAWFGQGTTEYSGEIFLEKDRYYPIKLEFFEAIGEARIELFWSSPNLGKSIVPAAQLFPALAVTNDLKITAFPNPVITELTVKIESPRLQNLTVSVFTADGKVQFSKLLEIPEGQSITTIPFVDLANGFYFVKFANENFSKIIEVIQSK
ncbi:MAG: PQQ-dependent sugar dehydrogenase [Bacteroidota bacterium]